MAGELDCTPIRTKKVSRQRTEPQYREWDEDVWDSEDFRSKYESLCESLAETNRACETRRAGLREAISWLTALEDALGAAREVADPKHQHKSSYWTRALFNPRPSYFTSILPVTRSGLVGLESISGETYEAFR